MNRLFLEKLKLSLLLKTFPFLMESKKNHETLRKNQPLMSTEPEENSS